MRAASVTQHEGADLIRVQDEAEHEIVADQADIHVSIKGSSLFSGQAALKKAREVSALVEDLLSLGMSADDIHLQGVSASAGGGSLVKSSQATYRLRIRCSDLEKLVDIIGVVTAQKSADLRTVEWLYPEDAVTEDAWLTAAIRRANEKSVIIAAALGVKLLGVYDFAEHWSTESDGNVWMANSFGREDSGTPMARRTRQLTSEDLGMEIYHTKKVKIQLTVAYRVSGFDAG